ncbi:MAG: hypothetical protein KAJ51_12570 [Thermoplasmata archaeon]|nr:hypothetical protein [Thermoplasmata archaeon]
MKRKIWLVTCILVLVLVCNMLITANAETFNIGNKISESGESDSGGKKWYTFDSGVMIGTNPDYINYTKLIFDGNESTGIDHDFGPGHDRMLIYLVFPYPFNITNITMKPTFKGNSSEYVPAGNLMIYSRAVEIWFDVQNFVNKTIELNFKVDTIRLWLDSNGTNQFSFNEVIINYTPLSSSNNNEIQYQIDIINQDIYTLNNNLISIDEALINLKQNITNIKNNIPSEYDDIAIKNQLNNLTQEIDLLNENLIKINNSIPTEYNDSALESNIFNLEYENVILQQKIGNMTIKIANLTTELEKLSSEVQNLQALREDKKDDGEQDNRLREYTYNIIFGVIIVILLIITLKLSLIILKRKHQDPEGPKTDDILISQIKNNMLTDSKMKETRLYDDENKIMLENRFQKGEMSQETHNYIKKVLAVSEDTQTLKK